jgi:DNA-3-methyladenine glycosylase I
VGSPDYLEYHDLEWGQPVRGDVALFERLCLEGFQAGLAWITILRKRPAFRSAFADFDPEVVAGFSVRQVERLMADPGIVRNRAKIEATIGNARALLALWERVGTQALDALVWERRSSMRSRPRTLAEVPAKTADSAWLSRDLRQLGFRFVGPTTCYAAMQACGVVDDHLFDCTVAPPPP